MSYLQWLLEAAHSGGMSGCDGENNKYGAAYNDGSGDTYDSAYADPHYGYFSAAGYGHGYSYGGIEYKESETFGGYGGGDYTYLVEL